MGKQYKTDGKYINDRLKLQRQHPLPVEHEIVKQNIVVGAHRGENPYSRAKRFSILY